LPLAALLLPATVVGAVLLPSDSPAPSQTVEPPAAPGPAEDRANGGTGPTMVKVGIYLNEIQAIDLAENTYTVDFYLWLQWTGDLDPSASLDFVNEDAKAFPRSRPVLRAAAGNAQWE
jgi:hypothetical protein